MSNPIYLALDVPRLRDGVALAEKVKAHVGGIKLGLEFFCAHGAHGVHMIGQLGLPIFLDLKLYDIPNTVAGAMHAIHSLEPAIITIHASGGRAMMEDAQASALVVLPEDFTSDVLAGRPAVIEIVRNPAEGIKPEIVVQGAEVLATYLDQASRLLGGELEQIERMIEADEIPDPARVALVAGRIVERIVGAEDYLFPPLVTIGSRKEQAEEAEPSPRNLISGTLLIMTTIMALLFVASRSVGDFFEERKAGMLRRQLTTPLPPVFIILAKIAFAVVLGLLVLAILALCGLLLGWIGPPVDLLGAIILAVVFCLAASGLLALVASVVRTERQAAVAGWLVVMGMSALGGSMLPVSQMPAPMQAAAPFTLNYWATDGFNRLILSGEGLAQILPNIGVLAAVGLSTVAATQVLLLRRFKGAGS